CNESGTDPDLSTFQPRVGFAYSLDQKGSTSIRGGYGMYTMQFPMQSFLPFAEQQPYIRNFFRPIPPSISDPWGGFPGGDPFASGFRADDLPRPSDAPFALPARASGFTPNFQLANLQKWNLTLERLFWEKLVVRASYVGTKGTHLSLTRDANAAIYIPGQSTAQNTDSRRPFRNIASVWMAESAGDSSYHSLQLSVERRLSGGLTFHSNYTWGKSLDTVSSNANGTLHAGFNTVFNPFDVSAQRGLSDFDLSHSWMTSLVWRIPSAKNGNLFLKHLASDWQATGIWIWQGGQPFSVFSGIDNSLSGVGLDLPDRVSGVSPYMSADRPRGEVVKQYFNLAAFQQNALGTFGNSGRNILRGPGFNNLDLAVIRRFSIKQDKYAVTFRAEFFNLTNTTHLGAPGGGGGIGLSRGAPAAEILRARDPRILQFALKFNW
ncbi:MAG: hypothetical protein L0312_31940, partial [Acidobacteria bacterium]|nr:hypothetical protein [Acidobacteriota bacterium]